MKNHSPARPLVDPTPSGLRRVVAAAGATLLLVGAGLVAGATPAAAAPPAAVTGEACLPGQGVTVAVDFAPGADEVEVGCALGAQATMAEAGAAAGFVFATDPSGFLTGIDDVPATAPSFWTIFINTSTGSASGTLTPGFTSSVEGISGGPVAVDTVLLFAFVPDWNVFPYDDPRITPAELGATAPGDDAVPPPAYPASGDGDALAAAGWIGRQLQAGGGVLPGPGGALDYGLTMDAIFALAAAGVGGEAIRTSAEAIYQSGTSYIGGTGESAANAGKIGKVVLALQVAGLDPTLFPDGSGGTRNLPEELRLSMTPDGMFGPNDFPLLHALVMLALDRTSGGIPAAAVSWLQGAQCPSNGGYGYAGCDTVDIDNTTLAIQALLAADVPAADPSVTDGSTWLAGTQQPGGGLDSSFGQNTNGTGLGGQTFLALGAADGAAAAAGFIAGLQVSCASLVDGTLLTADDVGAIAYDANAFAEGGEFGIGSVSDQWVRAGTQAILGLGLPAFDAITAAGADAALPAAPTCTPAATSEPVAPVITTPLTSGTTSVATTSVATTTTTPAGPQLSNTGPSNATLPMTVFGLGAIVAGLGLLHLARRTRNTHHS